ncbi:MAG TPA: type II toxin-antitoxin system HicB family antitoxin [Thermomicrobiales bacterium]|nr:type II toxin-antitoxin system HicB family antitoxin [Thermomicrobiales bacterium]
MPTDYIAAAMRHARYELLPEDEGFYGHIPELPGVWANADSLEDTHADLREALEGWITLALALHNPIPSIEGVEATTP